MRQIGGKGGKMNSFGRSRAKLNTGDKKKVYFTDVAGADEEKEEFEKTFEDDYRVKDDIASSAVNTWLFNADTIDKVLKELMEIFLQTIKK